MTFVAVVLAGGSSRRFGMDKLDAQLTGRLNGGRLLEEVVTGLSRDAEIVVVGPERPLPHPVCFVREDPPGGGPAAAMVVGLRAALARAADTIAVLPGDAPEAGAAATVLNRVLRERGVAAVVATDAEGRVQPLQLALSRAGAGQLIDRAGPTAGRHESARRLVEGLKPPALRWPLPAIGHFDIDTTEQLRVYRFSRSAEVEEVLAAVDRALSTPSINTPSINTPSIDTPSIDTPSINTPSINTPSINTPSIKAQKPWCSPETPPVLLLIEGPSGRERSALAAALALRVPAGVIIHQSDEHARPELTDRFDIRLRLAAGNTYDIAVGHLRNAASA